MSRVSKSKYLAIVLLLCFGVLTGFSPLLHNHDLDQSDKHEDCASCLWSQSNVNFETQASRLSFDKIILSIIFESSLPSGKINLFLIANRSPPFSL